MDLNSHLPKPVKEDKEAAKDEKEGDKEKEPEEKDIEKEKVLKECFGNKIDKDNKKCFSDLRRNFCWLFYFTAF